MVNKQPKLCVNCSYYKKSIFEEYNERTNFRHICTSATKETDFEPRCTHPKFTDTNLVTGEMILISCRNGRNSFNKICGIEGLLHESINPVEWYKYLPPINPNKKNSI